MYHQKSTNFQVKNTSKQWRSKWGHAPWGAGLGSTSAHFLQSFQNAF